MATIIPVDSRLLIEGPITKTADYNGASLDLGAGWAPDPLKPLGVLAQVTTLDLTDTNETYDLYVEESSDDSTFTSAKCFLNVPATGVYQAVFTSTKRYVRVRLDVGGTTPNIVYSVYVGPVS